SCELQLLENVQFLTVHLSSGYYNQMR
ncbi:MAG: hypothetical protein EZS28_007931, partial [Streblomastix strix]